MTTESLPVALRPHVQAVQKLLRVKSSIPEIAAFLGLTEADVEDIQYRLTNKSALVRAQLASGPKTTREIADATRIPIRIASALLSEQRRRGLVYVSDTGGRAPKPKGFEPVYALTDDGRAQMKKRGEAA